MSGMNTASPPPTAVTSTSASGGPTATRTVPHDAILMEPDRVESATPEFEFYYQWSLEERKQSMRHLADSLRYLTTLAAALLAGSLTYLTGRVDPWAQGVASLMLFASLCCGLVGVLPWKMFWRVNEPWTFRRAQERVAERKGNLLRAAGVFIVLAFVSVAVGLAFPVPPTHDAKAPAATQLDKPAPSTKP
jgi:hypothetical protein